MAQAPSLSKAAMTRPGSSGLQHLRQRWAQENFSDELEELPNEYGHDEAVILSMNVPLRKSPVPASGSFPPRTSFWRTSDRQAPMMAAWKERLPASQSFWKKAERQERRLAEVSADPPFPPKESLADEENAIPSISQGGRGGERETNANMVRDEPPPWLIELFTVSWLIFFAILGTLARLGVEAITQYPSAPVTSRVLWANVGGCFVMGFLIEDRQLFKRSMPGNRNSSDDKTETSKRDPGEIKANHLKFKKTIPIYIGLSTGFCGSFTSFSSFMRDAFLALTNALPDPSPTTAFQPSVAANHSRNGGFSFLALLAILILHPALSLASLKVGAQSALLLSPLTPRIPKTMLTKFLDPLMVLTSLGCWLGISLALTIRPPYSGHEAIVNWRSRALIPMLLAPSGCLLRYYLSKYMNGIRPQFPLGTFSANMLATAILGMSWDLQHASTIRSATACAVLQGVIEGFCGCLSTVSTWVVELDTLSRRTAWIYGGISCAAGLSLMVIIMGSMGWTIGFAPALCG